MKNWFENTLWFYAFLLIAIVYVAGLFIDLTGDAGLYAAITRQMVESGDWFNLRINGELYDQKPHLLFWLAGAGVKLFGNSNFAFKLFPVLYGWLGFYFTYRLGRLLYDDDVGKLAALLTGTSQIFILYSFDIHTDIVMQTGVLLALWQLIAYLKNKNSASFIFGFVGIGLAMLAKGPVGAVIPFLVVLLYLISKKRSTEIFHPKWLFGILVSLLVASPSLIFLFNNFGWRGIEFYFITNNFGRISGEYAGSSTDPFFYLYNAIWMLLPWTVFSFYAVFNEIKSWFVQKTKTAEGIAFLGSVLIFTLILSTAKGKAPNYFLVAIPLLLVITAKWITELKLVFTTTKNLLYRFHQIFLVVLAVFLIFLVYVYRDEVGLLVFTSIFILSVAAMILSLKFRNRHRKIVYMSLIFIGTFNFFINTELVPRLAEFQGARQALKIFEENSQPGDKLYNFALEEYELFFWAKDSVEDIKIPERVYKLLELDETWVYTNETKYMDIEKNFKNRIDTIYKIKQTGMNELSLKYLFPEKRAERLRENYLIKGHNRKQ